MGHRFTRRSVIWLFAVICLVVGPVKRTMADDRPRNVTLFLSYPFSIRRVDAKIVSSQNNYRVYVSHDGTAYVEFGIDEGVVIPPNLSAASAVSQSVSGLTDTATISGEVNKFNISLKTDANTGFHELVTYTLKIAGDTCSILASNFKAWTDANALYPLESTTVGTPTCYVRPGHQMFKQGE